MILITSINAIKFVDSSNMILMNKKSIKNNWEYSDFLFETSFKIKKLSVALEHRIFILVMSNGTFWILSGNNESK